MKIEINAYVVKCIIVDITNEDSSPYNKYMVYVVRENTTDTFLFVFDPEKHMDEMNKIRERVRYFYGDDVHFTKPQFKKVIKF